MSGITPNPGEVELTSGQREPSPAALASIDIPFSVVSTLVTVMSTVSGNSGDRKNRGRVRAVQLS